MTHSICCQEKFSEKANTAADLRPILAVRGEMQVPFDSLRSLRAGLLRSVVNGSQRLHGDVDHGVASGVATSEEAGFDLASAEIDNQLPIEGHGVGAACAVSA